MKPSIWDILTGVTLLGIVVLILVFGFMLMQPGPAPAATSNTSQVDGTNVTLVPTLFIPSATITNTPLPPTETPPVTATPTKKYASPTPIPSNTPVKLPTFTKSPRPGGSGSGSTSCIVTNQVPADGAFVLAGQPISVSWTIKNTSAKTWRADSVDIKNTGGVGAGAKLMDMQYDVSPQGNFELSVTLNAQSTSGEYSSNWGLYEGDTPICRFFVQFRVP